MIELCDTRVLGAIRFVDAVTAAPIELPLIADSEDLNFVRNLSGLNVITHAKGLEKYETVFDLNDLAPADVVATGSKTFTGEVSDPTGTYLPRKFTVNLPRNPSPDLLPPDGHRPADSLFLPIDVALLPSPNAPVAAGWAQVRVLLEKSPHQPLVNALVRVHATADNKLLGYGLSDARGEALVAIPGLQLFAPGLTPHEVVSVETAARLEIIPPATDDPIVDWGPALALAAAADHIDPKALPLRAGATYSRRFPFPP